MKAWAIYDQDGGLVSCVTFDKVSQFSLFPNKESAETVFNNYLQGNGVIKEIDLLLNTPLPVPK